MAGAIGLPGRSGRPENARMRHPRSSLLAAAVLLVCCHHADAQSLSGLSLFDPLARTSTIGMPPSASSEMGPHSIRRWSFPDGNDLSVTARRADGRIVYMESSWGGRVSGSPTDYPGVNFGETTLNELRRLMGSNGFTYASRAIFKTDEGVGTSNSYEIAGRPGAVLTFISLVRGKDVDAVGAGRRKLGDVARIGSVILADAGYLDGAWGREKNADPAARPIVWSDGTRTAAPPPVSAPVAAADGPAAPLLRALECRGGFKPEVILGTLQRSGVIGRKPAQRMDGIPSYVPTVPVEFHGLTALTVEGWNYEGSQFTRAPGTAPPVHVAMTVVGDEKEVTETLKRNGIVLKPHEEGRPFLYVTDAEYSDRKLAAQFRGRKLSSVICSVH